VNRWGNQAGVSRVSIEEESEQDAADDRERLRRLGSDSDSDEDDESLGRRAARANDALADLGRAKEQAKARIAQVRSVAAERAEKSTRCATLALLSQHRCWELCSLRRAKSTLGAIRL
jgi:hypothetical protein